MKKISFLLALVLSLSLLSACGGNESEANTGNSPSDPSVNSQQAPDESAEQTADSGVNFLSPEYDYSTNELKLTDLSTGEVTAAYAFDAAQTPLLTDKTSGGAIVMLSSQTAADVQDTGGVTVISGDSSAETLYYWLFDQHLNLVNEYELTNETLVNGLWSSVFAAAPDGKSLVYAEGPSLYQYTFDTQELAEITPAMSETVYFEAVGYSDSGNYLAFFGSLDGQENTTAYGSIDLSSSTAAVFTAKGFSGSMLSVNGEYAAISDTILPASMGGAKQTGSVLFLDLAQQQGKAISVESGDESGIATVSTDGQYIVTCAGGDSPSGTLRAYQVSDGTKVADETYTMDTNCKPYEIWVIGHSAYAALGTDDGYTLSQAVDLP